MSQNQLNKQIRRLESKISDSELNFTPIIVSDSKARYLEQEVIAPVERKLVWWFQSGASAKDQLHYIKDNLEVQLQRYPRIILYIWVGTCDLTKKEGKFIYLRARDNILQSVI